MKENTLSENPLYKKINIETEKIALFLEKSFDEFPKLFDSNFNKFDDLLNYLKNVTIPNKYVCAKDIRSIPGWTCQDCAKYTDSIFCHDCYKKSKNLHKNHRLYFLPNSSGMCGCGEPEALYTFCPEHNGPHTEKEQINEFISKVFPKEILEKINTFFTHFFQEFSKYFILVEKCKYFCTEKFHQAFEYIDNDTPNLHKEKMDIVLLKFNFCIVYQNFLNFIRLITENNLGMLYIISNYFLESYLENITIEEDYKTSHRCIKFDIKEIQVFNNEKGSHICHCPFFTLFLCNWRNAKEEAENEKLLLSFTSSFPLKHAFGVIYFAFYKQILQNNNSLIINDRIQFILDYTTAMLAEKTAIIEETYDYFYENFLRIINSTKAKNNSDEFFTDVLEELDTITYLLEKDCELYSMPITRKLMNNKVSMIKKVIDCLCLIHNEMGFRSIFPHPIFQEKKYSSNLIELELHLLSNIECFNMIIQWDLTEQIKETFRYLINKIINQEAEGIKQLKTNEFTFHLGLYRCFGLMMNYFCFNYSLNNNCSIYESIQIFIKNIFISENEVQILTNLLINDYFKFYGFISGIKNGYFNYYDSLIYYPIIYLQDQRLLNMDFTLLKYLFIMSNNNINLNSFLKISNIENTYSSFEKIFLLDNIMNQNEFNDKNQNNNISSEALLEILNNAYDIFPPSIDYGNNLQVISSLQSQFNTIVNPAIIQEYINNGNANNIVHNEEILESDFMQIEFLLELLLTLIKDNISPYWSLMRFYRNTSSTKTKGDLFDVLRKNKNAMEDLENILREEIIHEILSNGNLSDLTTLKKDIDDYLIDLFDEKDFCRILDELTSSKMIGEKKMFYLKDSSFKYLDIYYYYSPVDKSESLKYIFDFKKDKAKTYNTYYFNPSKLTFDFFKVVHEKILLNKNNLEIIIKIIEKLFSNELEEKEDEGENDINSKINSFCPIILKYLSIFGCINTRSFFKFKVDNEKLIDEICQILSNAISQNKENQFIEKDIEDNINEVINQLNKFKEINILINNNLSKLNEYDYNIEINEKLHGVNISNENKIESINNNKAYNSNAQNKLKNIKEKLKNKINKKIEKFIDNSKSNEEIINEINKDEEKNNQEENEICFFCRNPIKINSFEEPYGKGGYIINDFFYSNSFISKIKSEIMELSNDIKYLSLYENYFNKTFYRRTTSCGHYFHYSCFKERNNTQKKCPLCLKKQNILILSLNNFNDKCNFLKSYKINVLFNKEEIKENQIEKEFNLLSEIVNYFDDKNNNDYLEQAFPIFQSQLNYLENIFYYKGTYFNKKQQIDINQNFILSLRYLTYAHIIDNELIINYIKNTLLSLVKGPQENDNILNNYENLYYIHILEKLLLFLSILFDYEEMKEILKYIILIFIPYFSFGFYLRFLTANNNYHSFYDEKNKQKLNEKDLKLFFESHNQQMVDSFKYFLQKLTIIKIFTDFKNNNDKIINSFNDLNIEKLLSIINMDNLINLFQKNEKNEIKFLNIIAILQKEFNLKSFFNGQIGDDFDYNNIYMSLINNVKNYKYEDYIVKKEILIQFSPIKFEFFHLDKNIFDFIENNLEKKCIMCNEVSRYFYICLICGNKICHTKTCNKFLQHTKECVGSEYCIFIDITDMKISIPKNYMMKTLSYLYINNEGIGPKKNSVGREFNLSEQKVGNLFRNFICYDLDFN